MRKKISAPLTSTDIVLLPDVHVSDKDYNVWKQKNILTIAMSSCPKQVIKEANKKLEYLPKEKRDEYLLFIARMEPAITQ
jgi:hypothetical protein